MLLGDETTKSVQFELLLFKLQTKSNHLGFDLFIFSLQHNCVNSFDSSKLGQPSGKLLCVGFVVERGGRVNGWRMARWSRGLRYSADCRRRRRNILW